MTLGSGCCARHEEGKRLLESPSTPSLFAHILTACADWGSVVAVHGIGSYSDDSWCKNVGTEESPRWVNWLEEESMLPAVAPNARIMRYGYQSQWFGEGAMRQKASMVAQRLLLALRRKREVPVLIPITVRLLTLLGVSVSAADLYSALLRRASCADGEQIAYS
jgi:hypothetical protein